MSKILETARECITNCEVEVAEAQKDVAHYQQELDWAKETLAEAEAELAGARACYELLSTPIPEKTP